MNRSEFIQRSALTSGIMLLPALFSKAQDTTKPPPLKLEDVQQFVRVAHSDLAKVKEQLEANPQLLHVSYDWGGGDFESAIEAAGHVGNKDIAGYLLAKGARYNIYLACMLGHLDTVKNVLTFSPQLLNSKGPHGFTMLHHARKGAETSKPVEEYLLSLGAKDTRIDFYART